MWRLLLSLFQGPGAERPPSTGFQSAPATLPAAEGNGGRVSRSDTLPEGFDLLETPAGPRLRAAVDHPTSEIIGGVIFSSMMFRWATAAVPESTFEHVETLQVDNYIDAGDTQFLHTGPLTRANALVALATGLPISDPASAAIETFQIPRADVQIVRQNLIDTVRPPGYERPWGRFDFPEGFCDTRHSKCADCQRTHVGPS